MRLPANLVMYVSQVGEMDRIVFDPSRFALVMVAFRFAGHWRVVANRGALDVPTKEELARLQALPITERPGHA